MFYRSAEMSRTAGPRAGHRTNRRRLQRARPMIALALIAFTAGLIVGAAHSSSPFSHKLAARFTAAWARGDYAEMYADIDPAARRQLSVSEFAAAYAHVAAAATATRLQVTGKPRDARVPAGAVIVPVRVRTSLFGTLPAAFTLPLRGHGAGTRIAWSRALLFPGLRPGEELSRSTTLPPRAALLARDGSTLAPDSGTTATLERALDSRLRGTPGGTLYAGGRVLARATARAAAPVHTTISPALQSAAVLALGARYGGIVALAPASGAILAVAGIGLEELQPPGSTFKMITLTAALEAGKAKSSTVFPYATYATLDGVKLSNANGEDCGGSLALAFAVSCNSVFAPLGVKVGAARLVATAERFGFNQDSGVVGAPRSTIPAAGQIQGELDVGSTAIGQGEVQASALQMAVVAATVADRGLRPRPSFTMEEAHAATPATRVMSASVAHTVRRLMIGVVREGTGTSAAIPGVTVAGKTGTAELGMPSSCKSAEAGSGESSSASEDGSETNGSGEAGAGECAPNDPHNTDAWFAAFAPALKPRIVVCVLLPRDGAGGDTAAPVAREVLEAGLKS
jgi:penicillin-binding protein A